MVDRAKSVTSTKDMVLTPAVMKRYITFESTVSQSDTITINEVTTLLGADLLKKSDGTAITCTVATNVITVTGAGTNVDIIGIAYGTP
jgi:hypothetical protein